MGTRKYPLELRERAVRMYREAEPKPVIRRMAEELGVQPEALRNWIRQAEADAASGTTCRPRRRTRTSGGCEETGAAPGQRGPAGGVGLFRRGARPDPEAIMSSVDAHAVSVDRVLRGLGLPARPATTGLAGDPAAQRRGGRVTCCGRNGATAASGSSPGLGSPRMRLELRRRGVRVARKRVERLVRGHGRQDASCAGFTPGSTRQNPRHRAAPDLLGRDFSASAPNQVGRRPHEDPHRPGRAVAPLPRFLDAR